MTVNNSTILADNQTQIVNNGGQINLSNNSVIETGNWSVISLLNGATMTFDDSVLDLKEGTLDLANSSTVEFNNGSLFKTRVSANVKGRTPQTISSPDIDEPFTPNSINSGTRGDRIIVNGSRAEINSGTWIFGEGSVWEGLYFINSGSGRVNGSNANYIRASIENTQNIVFYNSITKIELSDIKYNRGFQVLEDSDVAMIGTNYHENIFGINIQNSNFYINDSAVYENEDDGIKIKYLKSHFVSDTLSVYSNSGTGIYNLGGSMHLQNTHVYDNEKWGLGNLSLFSPMVYNSQFGNNVYAEVVAFGFGFPYFYGKGSAYSEIYDVENPAVAPDRYLMMAFGDVPNPLYTNYIIVNTTDASRFYPDLSTFSFTISSGSSPTPDALYSTAMSYIAEEDYSTAYATLVSLINTYPSDIYSRIALSYLPFLYYRVNVPIMYSIYDFSGLYDYLDSISDRYLSEMKDMTIAHTYALEGSYLRAAEYYEQIIQSPSTISIGLIAELDQAYCNYMAVIYGLKGNVSGMTRTPRNYAELVSIEEEILNKLLNRGLEDSGDIVEMPALSTAIYPNPFNPETVIEFGIRDAGFVNIEVFNIKGQKVKTLLNEFFESGTHSIVWHGTNDYGHAVGSGIYFYRLRSGEHSLTRKMLLLK